MLPTEVLRAIAIILSVLAAVGLAFGAQLQNDSVRSGLKTEGQFKLKFSELIGLTRRPRWLLGSLFLFIAVILQLAALTLAPLIVVQPIGAVALVLTSILNARVNNVQLGLKTVFAIAITMAGIGSFVVAAARVAKEVEMTDEKLLQVLGVLVLMLMLFALLFVSLGEQTKALNYIFGAGVLYGFVATLAKVVIQRLIQGDLDLLTAVAFVALVFAAVLGGWFVQNAYTSGPPDLVIAGLTVIDPMIAVGIGIVILGEAAGASTDTVLAFVAASLVAASGVYLLEKTHPQLKRT